MACQCENCGRTQLNMETVSVDQIVVHLCLTCAYMFKQSPTRLKLLVSNQSYQEANPDMKKQHQLLSALMIVGIGGLLTILGLAVSEHLSVGTMNDYLSFIALKRF